MKDSPLPFRRAILVCAVAILTCGVASADTIIANSVALGGSIWIGVYQNSKLTDTQEQAGVIAITVTDNTGSYGRQTMCVDLLTKISLGTTYNTGVYVPSAFSNAAALERIAYLEDTYWPTTATNAEAMQLAIWDIEMDGGDGFSSGVVRAATGSHTTTTAVLDAANTYLSESAGHYSNLADVYLNFTRANPPVSAQMLEGPQYPTGPPALTPESSTFMLAGAALLALGHTARRKLGSR